MVETITPVVHGGRARWVRGVVVHAAGAAAAGALFGAGLGAVGSLLGAPWGPAGALAIAMLAAVYAAAELDRVDVGVPQLRRQVPDWWRTYFGPTVAAFLYGAGLGVGFLTFLAHGTLVAVAGAAIAIGDPVIGAIALGAFGLARGAAVLVAREVGSEDDGAALLDRLLARDDRRRRLANGVALTAVALLAFAAALGADSGIAGSGPAGWGLAAGATVAGTFAWSAGSKLASSRRWRRTLGAHALPAPIERVAAPAVPVVELVVPALALVGFRRASAGLAIGLLVVFSAEIVRLRLRPGGAEVVPCGCFGDHAARPASTLLARNAALALVAGLALAGAPDAPRLGWPGVPSGAELVPAFLSAAGLLVAAWAAWRAGSWLRAGRRA